MRSRNQQLNNEYKTKMDVLQEKLQIQRNKTEKQEIQKQLRSILNTNTPTIAESNPFLNKMKTQK